MKTEASRKPIPLEAGLAEVLLRWRAECAYNRPDDYIFASIEMDGEQPLGRIAQWRTTSALRRSELASPKESAGTHSATFGTLLKSNGEDVATVQSLMRHANVSVTMDRYVQAVTPAKRKAQRTLIQ
jgi:integrase